MKSKLFRLIAGALALAPAVVQAQEAANPVPTRLQAEVLAEAEARGDVADPARSGQDSVPAEADAPAEAPAEIAALAGVVARQEPSSNSPSAPPDSSARIETAIRSAAEAGIPVSLLENKVAEGEAKQVPGERIAVAVEARLEALLRAAGTLRRAGIEAMNAGDLSIAVDALSAGVTESALIRVAREAPPERRMVAIAVLADLVRLGNDSQASAVRVNSAISTNATLANLSAEVAAHAALANLQAEVTSQLETEGLDSILNDLDPELSGGLTGAGSLGLTN